MDFRHSKELIEVLKEIRDELRMIRDLLSLNKKADVTKTKKDLPENYW